MEGKFLSIVLLAAALLAGCGSGAPSGTDSTAKAFHIPAPTPKVVYAKDLKFRPDGLVGPEPKPVIPDSPPPHHLALLDLEEGIGQLAEEGSTVTIQYVGYVYDSKKKFYSSWDRGRPSTVELGEGKLTPGWEEGLAGMEVSDRRELVVPPDLAYGEKRVGSIPPGSTLVYVVDLLKVNG